jgi:putative ABC transport system permease protein
VAQILLDRLSLGLGDEILVGQARFELRAIIVTEPDALSEGFGFAPRLMISRSALDAAGLIRPGSLVEYSYRVRIDGGASAAELSDVRAKPASGFRMRAGRSAQAAMRRRRSPATSNVSRSF